jgi:flavorubredoxin
MFNVTDDIIYVGVNDKDIDLFESQYIVPNGVSYNSYLIKDDKYVLMDSVDKCKTDEWLENIEKALDGHKLDYLVIQHLEPDHSGSIGAICKKYPDLKIVSNSKVFDMLPQFFNIDNIEERKVEVYEQTQLCTGTHILNFYMAPMVHWPEVMFTFDERDKVLFSADAFGKFGSLDTDEEWACEARRYYFNIVGKYGMQVQSILNKVGGLDIKIICPLHGPILQEDLAYYLNLYNTWSNYDVEAEGVFIAYASIHGNTKEAALKLKEILENKGCPKVAISDLSREDFAEAIEDCFKYGKIVFAASSYNAKVFPPMEHLLTHLKDKNYQKRTIGLIENGSWAPSSIRTMEEIISNMKDITIVEPKITIKTTMTEENIKQLEELADSLLK